MKTKYLLMRAPMLSLIFSLVYGIGAPVAVLASSSSPTITNASATIDASSLVVESGKKARLFGTASSTTKIRYEITATSSGKTLAKSKTIKVHKDGSWSGSVSKKLKDGSYDVTVYAISGSKKREVAEGTLVVGTPPATLSVSFIPLLTGGSARANTTVPVSYLQVRNVSSSTVALKGFWLAQTGSASDASVTGFSSVDDKGGSRAATSGTALKSGKAYVPSTAVLLPGERKLFTIKAQLAPSVSAGSTLMLDVTGIDAASSLKGAFPIKGTTWTLTN